MKKEKLYEEYNIILFDGICNLCNGAVQFIIKRDSKDYFHFSSLQSATAKELLKEENLQQIDSIIFIEKGKIYYHSTAVLRIMKHLSGLYPLLYIFIIVPAFLRDAVYKFIAKNRYRWFGKQENDQCLLPTPALEKKLLK